MKFICLRRMIDKNRISMHTVSCYNLYRFTFSIHIFIYFPEIWTYFSWAWTIKVKSIFQVILFPRRSDEKTIHPNSFAFSAKHNLETKVIPGTKEKFSLKTDSVI